MNPSEMLDVWAPPEAPWSRWAKPVLFAEMGHGPVLPVDPEEGPRFDLSADEGTGVVVDLPGAESVRVGLALARDGYRPVPLFNGAVGPAFTPGASALVDVLPIVAWLAHGATLLPGLNLPAAARPAFLLDAQRQAPLGAAAPGRFDNRWVVFPQDFPSATFLRAHGVRRMLLFQRAAGSRPADDLAHVLRRWQEAGLELLLHDPLETAAPRPLHVERPSHFRWFWSRALALAGLRRNSAGGFGSVVPQPSSGG